MPGITITGLGSGLDTQAIIKALLDVERVPITALQQKREDEQGRIDLLGSLKGYVDTLRGKASALSTVSSFLAFKVTGSSQTAASYTATGAAKAGSHTLVVKQLATADRWAFNPVASATTNLATANGQGVSFTYDGTTYDAKVNQSASTLNDVASAINTAAANKVTASVVNVGTAAAPSYQLVLAGSSTGKDKRIGSISSTISGLTINSTPPTPGGAPGSPNNLIVGSNAIAVVDGLQVERSTNVFNDVIQGVSINLLSADPALTVNFTVEPDKAAVKTKIKDFVEAYNAVASFIQQQNSYSEKEGVGGPLFGDNLLATVQSTLRGALFNQTAAQIAGDLKGYGTLRLVGVEAQSDGTLKINDAVLDAKMDKDLDAFADLFVDKDGFDNGGALPGTPAYWIDLTADSGLADTLTRAIDRIAKGFVDSTGKVFKGLFEARTDAFTGHIRRLEKQIEDREFRLSRLEESLVARFAALEGLLAQLQSQQAFLNQQSAGSN